MIQAKVKTPNTTGNCKHMTIKMEEPLKLNFHGEDMKNILLLVGANGTGKTFVLVTTYVLGFILQTAVGAKGATKEFMLSVAQFTVDNCYNDLENITGILGYETQFGAKINMTIEKGKVIDIDTYIPENITEPSNVVYMSSNIRLFSGISMYLKLRKANVGTSTITDENTITKMLESYKLYDIMCIEKLIISMPYVVDSTFRARLDTFDVEDDITSFNVDLVQGEFYAVIGADKRKNLSSYGNGHQALLNMILTQTVTA